MIVFYFLIIGSLWAGKLEDSMGLQPGSLFRAPKFDTELPSTKSARTRRLEQSIIDKILDVVGSASINLVEGRKFCMPKPRGGDDVYIKYRGQIIVFTQESFTEGAQEMIRAKADYETQKEAIFAKWAAIKACYKPANN